MCGKKQREKREGKSCELLSQGEGIKGKRFERIFNNFNHTLWLVLHFKCPGRIVKYSNSFPKALGNMFGNCVSQKTQTQNLPKQVDFFMFLSCLIVISRQKLIQHVYTASICTGLESCDAEWKDF